MEYTFSKYAFVVMQRDGTVLPRVKASFKSQKGKKLFLELSLENLKRIRSLNNAMREQMGMDRTPRRAMGFNDSFEVKDSYIIDEDRNIHIAAKPWGDTFIVHIRKWYNGYGVDYGTVRPSPIGIAVPKDKWRAFMDLIRTIIIDIEETIQAIDAMEDSVNQCADEHQNQESYLQCSMCNPNYQDYQEDE